MRLILKKTPRNLSIGPVNGPHLWRTAKVPALTLWTPSSSARLPSSAAVTSGEWRHAVSPFGSVMRCCSRSRDVMSCNERVEFTQEASEDDQLTDTALRDVNLCSQGCKREASGVNFTPAPSPNEMHIQVIRAGRHAHSSHSSRKA